MALLDLNDYNENMGAYYNWEILAIILIFVFIVLSTEFILNWLDKRRERHQPGRDQVVNKDG